ncbi:hypothetical protein FBZ96_10771 [Bradyrhizobium stylosanthis]|uniref:Uncharacterized protein n=1 Tax=Bradyrhizobium stylosanthis TaxID=1803665 RepID=A0A560DFL4_9BRAD|nr:hypothetical protein FBZ96_10771 [Bradyrhizobium stylosanthis]
MNGVEPEKSEDDIQRERWGRAAFPERQTLQR